LTERAAAQPYARAIVVSEGRDRAGRRCYSQLTYQQLVIEVDRCARALQAAGIERGMRVLLMVRPGHRFVALTFALFKLGAIPVLIDPGMGRRNLLVSIATVGASALVGVSKAHLARRLFPAAFRTVRIAIGVDGWCWGARALESWIASGVSEPFPTAATRADEMAAILFTTGSTGPAKGVVYEHGMFVAQLDLIRERYRVGPGDIDLPCFPLFALFSLALGATVVVPEMDPSRPGRCRPQLIVEAIEDQGVTFSFGSPAIWRRVAPWCRSQGRVLSSLRLVLMAGAPIPANVLAVMAETLAPGAVIETPYGATEALPVCSINHHEILGDTAAASARGAGTCVGRPLPGVELRVIEPVDGVLRHLSESHALPPGAIGELIVRGPMVTREYFNLHEHTAKAKVQAEGGLWHRMGDLGYLDAAGRVWFCGRVAHRVLTAAGPLYSVPCEAIFNQHPAVARSALVGLGAPGQQQPVVVIELQPGNRASAALTAELLTLGAQAEHTRPIAKVLYHPCFPTDVRHNAKIFREQLAIWAARRIR
jgi:acyl-CoA synthetase (AMP-forming)/AMP-acid ligase II